MASSTPPKTRRSSIALELKGTVYKEIDVFHSKSKLQNGQHIIGRMIYLCTLKSGRCVMSQVDASNIVAKELVDDWISKNVYPVCEKNVAKKIRDDYGNFQVFLKKYRNTNYKRTDNWNKKVDDFNHKMTANAYDIRTKDKVYQKKLESTSGIKMTEDDEQYYLDNCYGSYTTTSMPTISRAWQKQTKRNISRAEAQERKRMDMQRQQESELLAQKMQYLTLNDSDNESCFDPDFDTSSVDLVRKTHPSSTAKPYGLRSQATSMSGLLKENSTFPQIPIRTSKKCIDEKIIRCTVQCLADHKVSREDVTSIIIKTANIIFGQNWKKFADLCKSDMESELSDEENAQQIDKDVKRRRSASDLLYVFPSNRCIDKYLEDAAYLNLKKAAEYLVNKHDEDVVTIGLDDTTKAAGHKLYDIKADHITISGPNEKRTLTTGYLENVSHSGADGAAGYEIKLKCLAVLAGVDDDELKSVVDFWITDRAGDCGKLLEELGVREERILKCCAHLILGVDHSIDKVFRDTENKIGVQKLLDISAGEKAFLSPSTSIHTLAQIAIAKLLSPSHASHSVSLFNEYKSWMGVNNIDHNGFKGFTANRFGRIAEIAKEFLTRRQSVISFFDSVVDINSNKLVLAVSTYIQNDWFLLCSEVYNEMGELLIFPIMELLGIDNKTSSNTRGWLGVRDFFKQKTEELRKKKDECDLNTGKGRLVSAVIDEILNTLDRQLGHMNFKQQTEPEDDEILTKMLHAPLTNLGCESEFAKLDNRLKVCGGSTSIQRISQKNIVTTNAYLVNSEFQNKCEDDKKQEWKWARTSDEVKTVQQMENDFLATVKQSKVLALQKKEDLKKKKQKKTMNILSKCKAHGGPVTFTDLHILDKLDEKQLLLEIAYLRATVAPDIRQKRRVKMLDGKFKLENFSVEELKTSIRNAVHPENELRDDVDALVKSVFT